ncbi:hypothetical protein FBY31_4467 [Arthrobacter sp. SLBN-100]|uniref:nuclear transport factor 2 family protein n=1 Tax=Arthrobacter sp. SLBN-100 TaxID=2768450 RepID=UPI00114F9B8A|nr:nuclear transport factor 2 family protein [Arthrobacter sp. SLBN-100]TQJ62087.1 hypothetical protein FBY31_4467 [Arthrobacter sp. SLBN-100]
MYTTATIAPNALADRLTAAISAADMATMREIYTQDAVIWHCTDAIEMSVDDLDNLLSAIGLVSSCTIDVHSRLITDVGFVQTQTNTYKLESGSEIVLRCALIVTVEEGLIARIDEYLDGSALAPLIEALPTE